MRCQDKQGMGPKRGGVERRAQKPNAADLVTRVREVNGHVTLY